MHDGVNHMQNRTMAIWTAGFLLLAAVPLATAHLSSGGSDVSNVLTNDKCRAQTPSPTCSGNGVSGHYWGPADLMAIHDNALPIHTPFVNFFPAGAVFVPLGIGLCDMEVGGFGDGAFSTSPPNEQGIRVALFGPDGEQGTPDDPTAAQAAARLANYLLGTVDNPTDALDESMVDGSPGGLMPEGTFDDGGNGCASHTHHYGSSNFNTADGCDGLSAYGDDVNGIVKPFLQTACDSRSVSSVGGFLDCVINDVVFAGSTESLVDGEGTGGEDGVDSGETTNVGDLDTVYIPDDAPDTTPDADGTTVTDVTNSKCMAQATDGIPFVDNTPAGGEVVSCTPGGGGDNPSHYGSGGVGVTYPGKAGGCPNGWGTVIVHNAAESPGSSNNPSAALGVATVGWVDSKATEAGDEARRLPPAGPTRGTIPEVCAAEFDGVGSAFTLQYPCPGGIGSAVDHDNDPATGLLTCVGGVIVVATLPAFVDNVPAGGDGIPEPNPATGSAEGELVCTGGEGADATATVPGGGVFVGVAVSDLDPLEANAPGETILECTVTPSAGAMTTDGFAYAQCFN